MSDRIPIGALGSLLAIPQPFALREYLKRIIELDELQSRGDDDSPRINQLADEMDGPWYAMSGDELELALKVSAALHAAWVES